jgi:hypothetical protein
MTYDVQSIEAGAADTALVEELLRTIARYCEKNNIVPCPVELRDTMLAVAALTHIEAAKMKCNEVDVSAEGFAEAASDRFDDVAGALSMPLFCNRERQARTLN